MAAAEKEPLPTTPEAKEKYFMEQVGAGESLCNRGKKKKEEKNFFFSLKNVLCTYSFVCVCVCE